MKSYAHVHAVPLTLKSVIIIFMEALKDIFQITLGLIIYSVVKWHYDLKGPSQLLVIFICADNESNI